MCSFAPLLSLLQKDLPRLHSLQNFCEGLLTSGFTHKFYWKLMECFCYKLPVTSS